MLGWPRKLKSKKSGKYLSKTLQERYRITKEMKEDYAMHKLRKAIYFTLNRYYAWAIGINRKRETNRLVNLGSSAHGIDRGCSENSFIKKVTSIRLSTSY